jgi:homoserine/homoserine lactone efflux protein
VRIETWSLYTLATLTLCVTPGPAVFYVLSQSLRHGWRRALPAVFAIQAGSLAGFALSASSIGALLLASPRVFLALKWGGAAYLLGLGVVLLYRQAQTVEAQAAAARSWRPARMFVDGFVIQLANPSTYLFFVAFLPQFIDASRGLALQMLIFALTDAIVDGISLMAYAFVAGSATRLASSPKFARVVGAVAGVMLILAGAGVVFVPQP